MGLAVVVLIGERKTKSALKCADLAVELVLLLIKSTTNFLPLTHREENRGS